MVSTLNITSTLSQDKYSKEVQLVLLKPIVAPAKQFRRIPCQVQPYNLLSKIERFEVHPSALLKSQIK